MKYITGNGPTLPTTIVNRPEEYLLPEDLPDWFPSQYATGQLFKRAPDDPGGPDNGSQPAAIHVFYTPLEPKKDLEAEMELYIEVHQRTRLGQVVRGPIEPFLGEEADIDFEIEKLRRQR